MHRHWSKQHWADPELVHHLHPSTSCPFETLFDLLYPYLPLCSHLLNPRYHCLIVWSWRDSRMGLMGRCCSLMEGNTRATRARTATWGRRPVDDLSFSRIFHAAAARTQKLRRLAHRVNRIALTVMKRVSRSRGLHVGRTAPLLPTDTDAIDIPMLITTTMLQKQKWEVVHVLHCSDGTIAVTEVQNLNDSHSKKLNKGTKERESVCEGENGPAEGNNRSDNSLL